MILNGLAPMNWAVSGLGIALVVLAVLLVSGKRLGMSTGFESVCSLVVSSNYFRRDALQKSNPWRFPLLVGLIAGGTLSALLSGGWNPTWDLGMFDTHIGLGQTGKIAWMFSGGVLVGFGTRLAGGCTSGHCIFGISNFEWSGLAATVAFFGAGLLTTNLIYRLILGVV